MYILIDTFNNCTISRHRTLEAAIRAQRRHLKGVRRANGPNSYLTYEITRNGERIDEERWEEAELSLDRY
jgi:hypothetical protein